MSTRSKAIILAVVASAIAMAARADGIFNPLSSNLIGIDGIQNPLAASGPPPVSCSSTPTGQLDFSNACNAVYVVVVIK